MPIICKGVVLDIHIVCKRNKFLQVAFAFQHIIQYTTNNDTTFMRIVCEQSSNSLVQHAYMTFEFGVAAELYDEKI